MMALSIKRSLSRQNQKPKISLYDYSIIVISLSLCPLLLSLTRDGGTSSNTALMAHAFSPPSVSSTPQKRSVARHQWQSWQPSPLQSHPHGSFTRLTGTTNNNNEKNTINDTNNTPSSEIPKRTTGPNPFSSTITSLLTSLTVTMAILLAPSNQFVSNALVDAPTMPLPVTTTSTTSRYWDAIKSQDRTDVNRVNERLLDYAVGTISTMYYDNTGGLNFDPKELVNNWKVMRKIALNGNNGNSGSGSGEYKKDLFGFARGLDMPTEGVFDSREGAVKGLKWIVSTLNDPYSKYLTRDELLSELNTNDGGFLGLGAIVEIPSSSSAGSANSPPPPKNILSVTRGENLPVITAISPYSPAERGGLVVNDRIVSVGADHFLGRTKQDLRKALSTYVGAENYAGVVELTVARPFEEVEDGRSKMVGYRLSRIKLAPLYSATATPVTLPLSQDSSSSPLTTGGNAVCRWTLLTPSSGLFATAFSPLSTDYPAPSPRELMSTSVDPVGYIRITRFSKAATAGFVEATQELERLGAKSYVIDVRNNYGGVIQEAMLSASALLRDPKAVLCYTLNSRGGFTPHDAEEYIVDKRYPGYLLSSEPITAVMDDVKRTNPSILTGAWVPPSSYASLHEQGVKRGSHTSFASNKDSSSSITNDTREQVRKQKKLVILMNEGTASSAEVFVSALRDNGRTVALVGAKTYGKGLIQHTFPMPDGGGLRLTVAEYLTPSLKHVTKVGGANFDPSTGELVGGGVEPDILCGSKKNAPVGVSASPGRDMCVGLALDALRDAQWQQEEGEVSFGGNGANGVRRAITAGVVKDDY